MTGHSWTAGAVIRYEPWQDNDIFLALEMTFQSTSPDKRLVDWVEKRPMEMPHETLLALPRKEKEQRMRKRKVENPGRENGRLNFSTSPGHFVLLITS